MEELEEEEKVEVEWGKERCLCHTEISDLRGELEEGRGRLAESKVSMASAPAFFLNHALMSLLLSSPLALFVSFVSLPLLLTQPILSPDLIISPAPLLTLLLSYPLPLS